MKQDDVDTKEHDASAPPTVGGRVTVERDGAAVVIWLDHPPVNALDAQAVDELERVLEELERPDVRPSAVVVAGRGRAFCAGADLRMISAFTSSEDPTRALVAFAGHLQEVLARLEAFPGLTVAAVHGPATGGGLELALACDVRIVASEALLGLPEVTIGLVPGGGGTQRLPRLVGPGVARRLALTGELVTGSDAGALGLAEFVVPATEVLDRARLLASGASQLPRDAVAEVKRCIALAGTKDGYGAELDASGRLVAMPECAEAIEAFLGRSLVRDAR